MSELTIAIAAYIAYLIGSISTAIIVCYCMGLPDPRRHGSQNPGATNVLRTGSKKAAVITLLGDTLKGFIPVMIARALGFPPDALVLIAFAAFLGHLYPLYFKFEGGKGVATALGCLLALSGWTGLCCILTWILVAYATRYSSLASLITGILAPFYIWYFTGNSVYFYSVVMISLFLIYRHQHNIANLVYGEESKIKSFR